MALPYDLTKWLVKLYGMTYYFIVLSAFGLLCLIVLPLGILSLIFVSFSIVLYFLVFHFLLWYFDCVLTHAMRFLFLYSNSIPLQKEMETYYLYTTHAPSSSSALDPVAAASSRILLRQISLLSLVVSSHAAVSRSLRHFFFVERGLIKISKFIGIYSLTLVWYVWCYCVELKYEF